MSNAQINMKNTTESLSHLKDLTMKFYYQALYLQSTEYLEERENGPSHNVVNYLRGRLINVAIDQLVPGLSLSAAMAQVCYINFHIVTKLHRPITVL